MDKITFSTALQGLKEGKPVRRVIWAPGVYAFRQVPSEVPVDVIQKMTSLPTEVKEYAKANNKPLRYSNQLARINKDNYVSGWAPSPEDVLAVDWFILDMYIKASDIVGTATPTE